jgi:hypothetical protein
VNYVNSSVRCQNSPRMANLHRGRFEALIRVFTNIGLDCLGPFSFLIGRRSSKRYGLLITCLSSRVVHLESLDSMDADSFIMALRASSPFAVDRKKSTRIMGLIYWEEKRNLCKESQI